MQRVEIWTGYKEEVYYSQGGEALAQTAQRSCGCPIPEGTQDQVGCSPRQLELEGGNPAHGRGVGSG